MEENNTQKTYKRFDGNDSIKGVEGVLGSIKFAGVGKPDEIQCIVQAPGYGMYHIKDIAYNNRDRSVRFIIDVEHPIEKADYRPDNNGITLNLRKKYHK